MSKSTQFMFLHLRASSGGWQSLHSQLPSLLKHWPGVNLYGSFMGILGVCNQDLFVLLQGDDLSNLASHFSLKLPEHIQLMDQLAMMPTVRPIEFTPLSRPGVYVFRFFETAVQHIDEITALSDHAWKFFETSSEFSSEPMALFKWADTQVERSRMLLLTWYNNMDSWEKARTPDPKAAENFKRRLALTKSVTPYATRLADTVIG